MPRLWLTLAYNLSMPATKPLKIFLCNSSGDKPQVKPLHDFLLKSGAAPWLDSEQLLPGQDWNLEINKSLDDSDVILLCLSKNSVDKEGYVQREMRIALDRALEMPEGCELPHRLQSYQWVDLFTAAGMDKLIKSLNIRAKQVKARQLSADGVPQIQKPSPEKKSRPKKSSGNTTVNITGDINGGNIIVGDNNEVNNQ
jgi:hypothetical protein